MSCGCWQCCVQTRNGDKCRTINIHDHGKANVLRHTRDSNSLHPSPKPEPLLHELLAVCTEEGDVVLDPFMGAGATLVAARDMGRRAIGMEVERKYCEYAIERLAQKRLF